MDGCWCIDVWFEEDANQWYKKTSNTIDIDTLCWHLDLSIYLCFVLYVDDMLPNIRHYTIDIADDAWFGEKLGSDRANNQCWMWANLLIHWLFPVWPTIYRSFLLFFSLDVVLRFNVQLAFLIDISVDTMFRHEMSHPASNGNLPFIQSKMNWLFFQLYSVCGWWFTSMCQLIEPFILDWLFGPWLLGVVDSMTNVHFSTTKHMVFLLF